MGYVTIRDTLQRAFYQRYGTPGTSSVIILALTVFGKNPQKMLIASQSQLAELARPIFISHFSSYLRIQICGGCIFAQQRSNDVCWHLRDHLMLTMMMLEMTPMIPLMLQ